MRAYILLLAALGSLPAAAQGPAPAAQSTFRSIELRGGGTVTLRYGPEHRVTVRSGGADRAIRYEGDKLVIDRCRRPCPAGHRIDVEVAAPRISALAVADGGLVQVAGGFPAQPAMAAAVSSGGMIDMRRLDAAHVTAAVVQGGRILASPRRELTAAVLDGGVVTYWGDPKVTSSVRRGGAVARGSAGDLRKPAAQLDAPLPTLPILPVLAPPVPPTPAHSD
ncbi:MAG TPA: DUF2807 domain-containing protein [Allosphingosinicella sp.]|jgi:hypothetical protein